MSNTFTIDGNIASSGSSTFVGDQVITGSLEATTSITASIFKGDGSTITSLNGTNISSGTVAAARIATLNQDTTGTAAKATILENTRTINGVDFNGSDDITTVEGNTGGTMSGGTLSSITIGTTEYSVTTGTGAGNVETSGTPVNNDYAKFTNGYQIEGRSFSEVRTDLNVADGADVTPSWVPSVNPNYLTSVGTIDLTSGVTGILPVPNGGTGVNTVTAGRILIGNGTSALTNTTDLTYNTSNKLLSAPTASFDHLIVSQVISSSVINTSGSNIFGDEATDTQTLNGSVILGNIDSATETDALFIDSSNTVKKRTLQANAFTNTTIGTTTNALTVSTGLNLNSGTTFNGSAAKTISVDVSDFMTNGSNNRIVTATGTDAMNAEANLTFDGSSLGVGAATAPSYELDVFGSIAVQGVAFAAWNSNIIKLGDFDGNGAKLALYDNTSAEIVRLTGGNVGIGTTSPGEKLEVVGNISASGDIVGNTLNLKSSTLATGIQFNNGTSGQLDLVQSDGGSFDKFYIKADEVEIGGLLNAKGDVQLGNDPTNLSDTITIVGHITSSGNISSSGFIKSDNSLRLGDEGDNGFLIISGSDSNNDSRNSNIKFQRSLEFRSYGGSTDEILTLHYLGNVGIGKANAAEKLEVVGNISSSGTITGNSFVKGGGTSAQFLKADGSVDSSTYSTATGVENNADVTPSWVPSVNPNYLTSLSGAVLTSGDQTASGTKTFSGTVKLSNAVNAGFDTNKFLVLDTTDKIDFRTGAEVRADIDAAKVGANSDITSLSGLTTALSVAQGGTGASNTSTARTNLGAASSGANTDITSIIDENLKVGGDVSETTENYINFTAGKIALTQGLNLVVHAGANLYPGTTNSMNLGTSAYMWADAYSRQFISDASTTSTPAFVVDKDETNTGFYYKGTNQLAVTIGGNEIGYFNASGLQVTKTNATSQFSGHLQAHCLGIGTAPSTTSGEIRAAGDVVANYSSDKRLKENIKPISGALDKLLQISGVTFDWIEKEEIHSHKGHDVGVIAQEVEEVLPEVVVTRDNGYKAVNYEKIVPLLIESIKDLKAEIDELKKSK